MAGVYEDLAAELAELLGLPPDQQMNPEDDPRFRKAYEGMLAVLEPGRRLS